MVLDVPLRPEDTASSGTIAASVVTLLTTANTASTPVVRSIVNNGTPASTMGYKSF